MKKHRSLRTVLLAGVLLFCSHLNANAQVFTRGSSQTVMVCQDASLNINNAATINDPTLINTDTIDVAPASGPSHGTLSGFPVIITGPGGVYTPTGLTYTPTAGYNGPDVFTLYVNNGNGPVYTVVTVNVNQLPGLTLGANPVICQGVTSTTISFSGLTNVGPVTQVFPSTSSMIPFTVPSGITSITFDVQGASGGNDSRSGTPNPGLGGRVQGMLAVSPGEVLNVNAGGVGSDGSIFGAAGGYNGGGNAYYYPPVGSGGAGGGASDIRVGGTALSNRIVVAGGGGGNGWDSPFGAYFGGAGGNLNGGNSQPNVNGSSATGGTQSSGGIHATRPGWTPGTDGGFGFGGDGSTLGGVAGGGGGGYYGGGGGVWNGGGGGSSFTDPSSTSLVSYTQGYNSGNGIIAISYTNAGTYSITWDAGAAGAGFTNMTAALPSSSSLPISVPAGTAPGVYTGNITVNNSSCGSISYPFSVTVNPTPDVTLSSIPNQTVCNGSATAAVNFAGSVSGTTFSYASDNTSFGLSSSDTTNIPSFVVNNTTANPEVANITVTPMAAGCMGTPQTFMITANPTPTLSSSLTPSGVCSGSVFNYNPTSLTSGASFSWTRAAVAGISNAFGSGVGNPNETLVNTTNAPIAVTYAYTINANGCTNMQNVIVMVNPSVSLTSTLTPPAICDSTIFSYTPTSDVAGATFSYTRNITTGITNPPMTGTDNPNEVLSNVTNIAIPVTYTYSIMANGCLNVQNVIVTVNPNPVLINSTLSAPAICSGTAFNYTPMSSTASASFQWNRVAQVGIAESGTAGSGGVNEVLVDTTNSPVLVTYQYTAIYGGCYGPVANVTVLVNPAATLNSNHMPAAICNNTAFSYMPTSAVSGASFSWIRGMVYGVSNGPGYGVGNINETLVNTTPNPIRVPYAFTITVPGAICSGIDTVWVTVNPNLTLTSNVTPHAICDSGSFEYTPTSNTDGAIFSWSRAYTPGILNAAATGMGNISESLINTTNVAVNVTYQYTVMTNGCSGTPVNVTVTVNPTPKLSSGLTAALCTGVAFNYTPTSYASGVTYDWTRPYVNGLTPGTSYGTGSVHETLVNTTTAPLNAVYLYRLTVNGCENPTIYKVVLTVNPAPAITELTTTSSSVCSNTMNQLVTASIPPANGVDYTWTAQGAVIESTTANGQYALVNFPNAGNAVITLTSTYTSGGCKGQTSIDVSVGSGIADNPQVIYFQGMFVCLENDEDTYQWGYDNASDLQTTLIQGATNQSYIDHSADLTNNNYFVITTHNGCTQKTYYNVPNGGNPSHRTSVVGLRVFPNPVGDNINVEVLNSTASNMEFEVLNMLGQKLLVGSSTDTKAVINATTLPPGSYLINCYLDGTKLATTRFIKN